MASLDEIACRHGTDKATSHHGFTLIYEPLFEPFRDQPIRLLEIGILGGASLRTWADYFTAATIIGIDRFDRGYRPDSDRITVAVGDQGDPGFMGEIASAHAPLSIVIDDGSHFSRDQKTSLAALWPAIAPGGIYAVEDTMTSYFEKWRGGYRQLGTFVEWVKEIVDDPNTYWHHEQPALAGVESVRVYTNLVIITKETYPYRGGVPLSPESREEFSQEPDVPSS